VLHAPDDDLLALLDAAFRVRARHHGRDVRLHVLQNAKSGRCSEDCAFCSQSSRYETGVDTYRLQTVEELVEGARRAHAMGAVKYRMVTRGPSQRDLDTVCEAVRRIKAEMHINVCTSLGLLKEGQAEQLAAAGVTRFNHNLESSERYYGALCSTHSWEERVATVKRARAAGLEACCGGIMGMGESEDDRLELAFTLRELEVESIRQLDLRPGTPGERGCRRKCLRILCMFLREPDADIHRGPRGEPARPAASRLRNSLIGPLPPPAAPATGDVRMIEDAGFRVAELVEA
jgi:biotin synthase